VIAIATDGGDLGEAVAQAESLLAILPNGAMLAEAR